MECFLIYEGEDINDNIFIALQYLFENEKTNLSLLKRIVVSDDFAFAFPYGPTSLRNDREVALHIINGNPFYMRWASPSLRSDKALALQWVKREEDLEYVSEALQKDPDVIMAATKVKRDNEYLSPITGDDIMHALGIKPGEQVGKLLARLKKEILDGHLTADRDDAMKFIISIKDKI
jgi:hypothetical protein